MPPKRNKEKVEKKEKKDRKKKGKIVEEEEEDVPAPPKKKGKIGEEEKEEDVPAPPKKVAKVLKKPTAVIGQEALVTRVKKGGKGVKNPGLIPDAAVVIAQVGEEEDEDELEDGGLTTGGQNQAALVPNIRKSPRLTGKFAASARKTAAAAAGAAKKKRGRAAQATKPRSRSSSRSGSSVVDLEEGEESAADSAEGEEDGDGTSAATKKTGKRGRKPTIHLSQEQEIEAIEFVKANPCFYDKSDDQWFQQSALDYKWEPLVKSLKKFSYQELLQWWNSFRTRYGKVKKKKDQSGSGVVHLTEREEFVYSHGNFLYAHIRQQVNRKPTKKIRKKLALTPMDDDEPDAQVVAGVEENPGKYIFIFLLNVS